MKTFPPKANTVSNSSNLIVTKNLSESCDDILAYKIPFISDSLARVAYVDAHTGDVW